MPDREKVLNGLTCCLDDWEPQCEKCPYAATDEERKHVDWDCHKADLQKDALELLKGQEPLVIRKGIIEEIYNYIAECPECGMVWAMYHPEKMRFCTGCGKAVKWD